MKINIRTKLKSMTCNGCGHKNKPEIGGITLTIAEGLDPYFGIDLLLQISFRNEVLWFYNLAHLEYVESYLQADIRERPRNAFNKNRTLISRLPTWIKQSKSRDDLLKRILKLKRLNNKEGIKNVSAH